MCINMQNPFGLGGDLDSANERLLIYELMDMTDRK